MLQFPFLTQPAFLHANFSQHSNQKSCMWSPWHFLPTAAFGLSSGLVSLPILSHPPQTVPIAPALHHLVSQYRHSSSKSFILTRWGLPDGLAKLPCCPFWYRIRRRCDIFLYLVLRGGVLLLNKASRHLWRTSCSDGLIFYLGQLSLRICPHTISKIFGPLVFFSLRLQDQMSVAKCQAFQIAMY